MPVQMVRGDVQQDSDLGPDRGCQVDLIGRQLQHVHPVRRTRLQFQHGQADVARDHRVDAGRLQHMPDHCGGGRLAVGPGDGNDPRARHLPHEQLDIADDFHPGVLRSDDRRMRFRMGQRDAWRQHQHVDRRPVGGVRCGHLCATDSGACLRIVVPGNDPGTTGQRCNHSGPSAAGEPQHEQGLVLANGERDHRPTSASAWRGRPAPG